MVLLIPAAWRKAKSEGRAEGRAAGLLAGRAAGRAAEHDRIQSVIAQFGQVDPDTGAITLGTEAQEQLRNGHGKP